MAELSSADIARAVREFGAARGADGDDLVEEPRLGAFFYTSGRDHAGIAVAGTAHHWRISIFAAARVRMPPSLELHRCVSAWRTTFPVGAPYVVESGGEATDLAARGGAPFVGHGVGGLLALHSWWENTDDRIGRMVG